MIGHPYLTWGGAGVAPPPPPTPAPAGPRPSGGFRPWITRRRRKLRPEEIQRVIETVALRQVQTLELDEQKRFEELERELEARGIEWETRYLELLNEERERLIHQEIGRLLRRKLEEEDATLLILLASSL